MIIKKEKKIPAYIFQEPIFPQDIYIEQLETIKGINFTHREIDIISCILNARGTSKIASFLSIASRTVETHIRNIMLKLDCNSRENIIDFFEKSDKHSILRKYYSTLLIHTEFEKCLREISRLWKEKDAACIIVYWHENDSKNYFFQRLDKHLKLAGINVTIEMRENHELLSQVCVDQRPDNPLTIYIIPLILMKSIQYGFSCKNSKTSRKIFASNNIIFLLPKCKKNINYTQEFIGLDYINFVEVENYYFLFFEILNRFSLNPPLERIISSFKPSFTLNSNKHQDILLSFEPERKKSTWKETLFRRKLKNLQKHKDRYPIFAHLLTIIASLLTIIVLFFGPLTFKGKTEYQGNDNDKTSETQPANLQEIKSDLIMPAEAAFLHRAKILSQIKERLNGRAPIQSVALVGTGGAGKTTLARQYAHQHKANVVWEINAETHGSLNGAFENLAYALSKNEEDKKLLKELEAIKNPQEKEEKIILCVKKNLKRYSNWILIYDNVEKFSHIQRYFPYDANTWGQGKVIITTRDGNIANNQYVNSVIEVSELDPLEKLTLFIKIMSNGNPRSFTSAQSKEAEKFLEEIPPFPLDVSIAAYYLKEALISYSKYLKYLKEDNEFFVSMQENLLKETGDYTKTRYNIIILSIKQLININKDFGDLLLFISLINSQNIPRELLDMYKNDIIVDEFIYNLKKYSLISNEIQSSSLGPSLSIHRSTQNIILIYIIKKLTNEKKRETLDSIARTIEEYTVSKIEMEDISRMKRIISHLKAFLNHSQLLSIPNKGAITGELGGIYFYLDNYIRAKKYLEESFTILENSSDANYLRIIHIIKYLGSIYREMGNYEKAKNLFEKSLSIFKKQFPENHAGMARTLALLGYVYREMGNYKKAKELFEESLSIYKQQVSNSSVWIAWASTFLGDVCFEIGDYKNAQNLLEQGFLIYNKELPKDHIWIAWLSTLLGNVYIEIGEYEKAKNLFERSLQIYTKQLPNNHVWIAWDLANLGNFYRKLRNFEKAKIFLQQAYAIYEKNYGKDHLQTARVLENLGQVYLQESQLVTAEKLMRKTLSIFQKSNHPDLYIILEDLGELNFKKFLTALNNKDQEHAVYYKNQAISYLKNALEIVRTYFPANSPHIIRIQSKLNDLKHNTQFS